MAPKILLIDDEESICSLVRLHFQTEGYVVYTALDTEEAVRALSHNPDLILLDINMPETDGLEFCRSIRNHIDCPILFLTSRVTEQDKITGLQAGGDDYITKPFSVAEVLARIRAALRRTNQYDQAADSAPAVLAVKDLVMNLSDHTLTKKGKAVDLTAKEYEILKLLLQNPKKIYTKEQIYSLVWNDAYYGDENAVNVHISRLRNKIEENPRRPEYIMTVWGIGYKLGDKRNE